MMPDTKGSCGQAYYIEWDLCWAFAVVDSRWW